MILFRTFSNKAVQIHMCLIVRGDRSGSFGIFHTFFWRSWIWFRLQGPANE